MSAFTPVRLDLEVLLASVGTDADPCVERLRCMLDGREGVTNAQVTRTGGRARLCVHFDPDRLSVSQVESLAEAAGLELQRRYVHLVLKVHGLANERRARLVEGRLQELPGVLHAAASASAAQIHVEPLPLTWLPGFEPEWQS